MEGHKQCSSTGPIKPLQVMWEPRVLLKQMGSRPYTYGGDVPNSASRSKSTKIDFDKKAQESVTKYRSDKLHIKDISSHYKKEKDNFLAWTS